MKTLMELLSKGWQGYTRWCDKMGLTEENRRCCMPRLQDPPLEKTAARSSQQQTNDVDCR